MNNVFASQPAFVLEQSSKQSFSQISPAQSAPAPVNLLPTLLPAELPSGSLALQPSQVLAMSLQNQSNILMQPQPQSALSATPELSLQQLASNPFMQMTAVPPSAVVAAGSSSNVLLSSFNQLIPGTHTVFCLAQFANQITV